MVYRIEGKYRFGNKNPNAFHVDGLVRDKETKTRDWGQVRATSKPGLESLDHQKVTEHFQLHEKRNSGIF